MEAGGTLVLNSGEISENNLATGGPVNDTMLGGGGAHVLGTFIMEDGTFYKNKATGGGTETSGGGNSSRPSRKKRK